MKQYNVNNTNRVKRGAKRASYDKELVHQILDDAFLCHVSYIYEGRPIIIPTAYGRQGEKIYIHGAIANRMMNSMLTTSQVTLAVTHLDGLVLARSAFHHSANYRSVVVFGKLKKVDDDKIKMEALKLIVDQMLPSRWEECRIPNEKEMKATLVLEIEIEYASAKVRSGGPVDDKEDYDLDLWAGELPIVQHFNPAIDDEKLKEGISQPLSVQKI